MCAKANFLFTEGWDSIVLVVATAMLINRTCSAMLINRTFSKVKVRRGGVCLSTFDIVRSPHSRPGISVTQMLKI